MLYLNHLTTLDPIFSQTKISPLDPSTLLVWPALLWPPPAHNWHKWTIYTIKHAKHDNFYFVHTNEISHLNIQVVNQASQNKKNTSWNKEWANSSRKWFTIGREPGAPHAPREELAIVALEEGSVEPKPWEPLRRRPLRVEVDTGMGSRAACRRLGT